MPRFLSRAPHWSSSNGPNSRSSCVEISPHLLCARKSWVATITTREAHSSRQDHCEGNDARVGEVAGAQRTLLGRWQGRSHFYRMESRHWYAGEQGTAADSVQANNTPEKGKPGQTGVWRELGPLHTPFRRETGILRKRIWLVFLWGYENSQ